MFAATLIYSLCVMALSSMAARFYEFNDKNARRVPHRMHFYLSFLRFGALIALVLLTYPILFNLSEPATVRTIINGPFDTTFGLLLVLGTSMLLSWFGTATVIASWVLLVQGVLFVTWIFSRISTSLGQDALL
ncbi:MAG: hypothetical protein HKN70_14110, partial [Gammaproteobacteria bacterium]|nr:hypothetical protein [Gammaproteobacteria bacterium]